VTKQRVSVGIVLAVMVGIAVLLIARVAPAAGKRIPTARVQRGRVQVTVYTTGELRAGQSAQLVAPALGNINLQIVKLAPSGERLKKDDVVVEFDPAELNFSLEQAKLDLAQADQELTKAEAQATVQAAEDATGLLHAKFDVRRAELDASGNELEGAIKAEQNVILLKEARERLAQLEKDLVSHRETSKATGNVAREKRAKALLAVQVAEKNIASLEIRAPFDGFSVLRQNTDAMGGFCCDPSTPLPEYRVGDTVGSGRTIADLIDTSHIEVAAKVNETDRANVSAGDAVEVAVDALPDAKFKGTVRTVAGVASRRMFSADAAKKFDLTFDIAGDLRIRPGATVQIAIAGPNLTDALYIPRQAVFDLSGRPSVYVKSGDGFEPRDVKVTVWTDSLAVVDNLMPGTEIALIDPTAAGKRARPPAAPAPKQASR